MEAFSSDLQGAELIRYVQTAVEWDYNGSFYFSQGNGTLQRNLLDMVDIAQRTAWPQAMLAQRNAANDLATLAVQEESAWPVPDSHAVLDKTLVPHVREEYIQKWMAYRRFIDARDQNRETVRDAEGLVPTIINGMIAKDRDYIRREGGGRLSTFSPDPYMSHVREYIVRGQETRSFAFDYIFGLAHVALLETRNQPEPTDQQVELESLVGHWEKRHPGEAFWVPPDENNPHIVPPAER